MTELYKQGWEMIIKPVQFKYDERDLGPDILLIKGHLVSKMNFAIPNSEGLTIKGTLFYIKDRRDKNPCLVYCHSHNGNRCEGAELLPYLIPEYNFCVFDYTGSGLSDGEYVTLGFKEQHDLHSVLSFLRDVYNFRDFFLWGRSMGAATALLYLDRYAGEVEVRGVVLDSPFHDAKEMVRV
jgi:pimeloyl-ACP methyl ester carboxylesterase